VLDRDGPLAATVDRAAVEADLAAGRWRDAGALWRAANVRLWAQAFASRPTSSAAA
jgi:hypothetical protein